MEKKNAKIVVERETFEKNGKTYFSYFIKGKIRGNTVTGGTSPLRRQMFLVQIYLLILPRKQSRI